MVQRLEAAVTPSLLAWARKDSRYSIEQVAKKLGLKVERVREWEDGTRRPTVVQLRKLATLYHRPLALFFLNDPPTTFRPMRDYRRLPGEVAGHESPALQLQVRRAHERRRVVLDLLEALNEPVSPFEPRASLTEDPEAVGARIRTFLDVTLDTQSRWGSDREAFNAWRTALEERDILVFQAVKVGVREARGFSISDTPLPVIVVNRKDSLRGRVFTLFHELAHVLLRDGGICDLEDDGHRDRKDETVEVFCNAVAAAALIPRDALLAHPSVRSHAHTDLRWRDEDLMALAREFNVSTEAVLRRLLTLRRTSTDFYRTLRARYLEEGARPPKKKGFVPPHRDVLSTGGRFYVRVVLQGYYRERITSSDVADYLNVRLNHLGKIERAMAGASSGVTALIE